MEIPVCKLPSAPPWGFLVCTSLCHISSVIVSLLLKFRWGRFENFLVFNLNLLSVVFVKYYHYFCCLTCKFIMSSRNYFILASGNVSVFSLSKSAVHCDGITPVISDLCTAQQIKLAMKTLNP